MNRARLRLLASLALVAVVGAASAATQSFAVEIAGGRAKGNDTLKVRQGDEVEVNFKSDRPMELHLHGYNITAKTAPPAAAKLTFKAGLAGRFPVHEHREGPGNHRAVLFIEVHP